MDRRTQTGLLLDFYGALLTQRQRALMRLHFDEDLSLAEIAEREGVSRQAVRDALVRGEAQLVACEEKLGFLRRDRELARSLRDLIAAQKEPAARAELVRLLERIEGGDGV